MPSEKRQRQRAYRERKRELEQLRRRRRRMLRGGGFGLLVVVVIIGLIALFGGFSSPKPVAAKPASTTTTTLPIPTTVPLSAAPVAAVCPPATAAGAAKRVISFTKAPPMCISPNATYDATFATTGGTFVVEMPAAESPAAVNNFVFLARYHFFDGTSFPRVVLGFVIQGGSPKDDTSSGPGYSWTGNLPPASCGTGASCYPSYSFAMANSNGPSTNQSQFFVVLPGGGKQLTRNYTLFGKVISGFKAVDQIGAGGSTSGIPPKVTYYIDKVTISEVASSGSSKAGAATTSSIPTTSSATATTSGTGATATTAVGAPSTTS